MRSASHKIAACLAPLRLHGQTRNGNGDVGGMWLKSHGL